MHDLIEDSEWAVASGPGMFYSPLPARLLKKKTPSRERDGAVEPLNIKEPLTYNSTKFRNPFMIVKYFFENL
jgi:hypothetical protein